MNKGLKKVLSYTLITTMVASMALTNFGGMGASVVKAEGEPLDSASLVNFSTILGRAVDFGITAVELDQNGSHSETNMAVKTFTASQNNDDPDLAGDQPLPFIIGSINGRLDLQNTYQNGKMTINIETTKEIIDNSIIINNGGNESADGFHTGKGYISIKDGNAAHSTPVTPDANGYYYYGNESKGFTTVYRESTQENINNNLDLMISHIQDQSRDLKAKTTNVDLTAAEAMDQNNYLIDLSDPKYNGKVVYINVDAVNYPKLAEHFKAGNAHNLKIKKWNSTVVVFNVPNTTTKINPIKVEVVDDGINEPEGGWFDSANTGGGKDNAFIDEYVCQKVVLNLYNATEVHLNAVAGTVLVPKENSETYIEGSSAGWIASAGKVTNVSAEFHFIYQGRSTTLSSNANGAMHFAARKDIYSVVDADGKPVERDDIGISANQFKFNLYETGSDYDTTSKVPIKTNVSDEASAANDKYSKILFPDLSFTEAGTHYYVIKEVDAGTTANRITNSNGEIRIKLDVAKSDTGVISFTVSSWHYLNNFDTSAAYKINDSKAMNGNEFSLGGFYNYYEPGGTLTVTKTISGTDSAYAPTTDRFKITLTGVVSSANLSGTYNVSGDAYAAATGTDKLSSITFTNGTSGDFYIAGGGSVSVIDIPAGAVITVAEEDKANYELQTTNLNRTMVSGQTDTVALDNRYTAPKGYLKFTKTFAGIAAEQIPTGVVFKIYNTLDTTTPIKTLNWTDLTKSNGGLTGTWTPTGASDALPVGTYIVKEFVGASTTEGIPITSYSVTVTGNGSTGVEVTTSSNGSVEDAADLNLNNAYTATNTANLSITKKVIGNSTKDGADFYVTVKGADNNYYNTNGIIVNENNARTAVRAGTNGNQGAAVVFSNLPLQTYTVTEEDASISGYSLTTSYNGVDGTSGSVLLNDANTTVNYPIINTYTELKGYLKFTKTFAGVESSEIPTGVIFKIYNSSNSVVKTLSWSDLTKSGNGLVGTWNPSDASEALPLGTYTVKEFVNSTTSDEGIPIANYSVAVTGNVSTGVAVESWNNSAGNAAELELTNTYTALRTVRVNKIVSGATLPSDFQITNNYNSDVFTVSNKTGGSGTSADPYYWEIANVPNNTTITFTESLSNVSGYDLTVYDGTGSGKTELTSKAQDVVASGTSNVCTFYNEYTQQAATTGSIVFEKTFAFVPTGAKTDTQIASELSSLRFKVITEGGVDVTSVEQFGLSGMDHTPGTLVWSKTISDLPLGTNYSVVEVAGTSALSGFSLTSSTSDTAVAALESNPNTYGMTNTYKHLENITIQKAVSGATLPNGFKITNDYNSTEFTVANKTGGSGTAADPYIWTIANVPSGTNITFTESGYDRTGYTEAVYNNTTNTTSQYEVAGGAQTVTVSSTAANLCTFYNVYTRDTVELTATKVWDDNNNADGKRPNDLVMTLSDGTTNVGNVTLNNANSWTGSLVVPEYDEDGNLLTYTWTEANVQEYALTSTLTTGNTTTFTNVYPIPSVDRASLSITKTVTGNTDKDGQPFYVTVMGADDKYYNTNGVVVSANAARTAITAGSNGAAGTAVVFNNLPLQTYTVTEESPTAAGYLVTTTFNGADGTVGTSGVSGDVALTTKDTTVDCAIVNAYAPIGSLEITKVLDTQGDTPTSSDTFDINVNLNVTGTYTVHTYLANGGGTSSQDVDFTAGVDEVFPMHIGDTIEIIKLPAGTTYTVSEPTVPTDYTNTGITNSGTGTIGTGIKSEVEVTNKYTAPVVIQTGSIKVTKVQDASSTSSIPTTDSFPVTITFTDNTADTYQVSVNGGTAQDVAFAATDAHVVTRYIKLNEFFEVSGVPQGVTYTVTEDLSALTGYGNPNITSGSGTIGATVADVTVANSYTAQAPAPNGITVNFSKRETGKTEELPGATLQLLQGTTSVSQFQSGTTPVSINNLGAGTYTLKELVPPTDYQCAADITFTIEDDGTNTGTLIVKDANGVEIQDKTIVMFDAKVPMKEVSFSKVSIGNIGKIAGAKLTLYSVGANGVLTKKIDWTSSETDVYKFTLSAGDYAIEETVAPEGYVKATSLVKFNLSFDTNGNAVIKVTEGPGTYDATNDVILIKNDPIQVTGKLSVHVEEKKTGRPVPDAEVEVTAPDGTTKTYKTNGDGEIVDANGNTPIDVPAGTYKIKIKSVPKGYDVDTGEVGDVTVPENGQGRHIAKIVSSTGGLKIKVLEEGTKREVPDATVVVEAPEGVKFPDGSTKITAITDKNGNITTYTGADGKTYDLTSGLTPGDYKITVTKVPAGYNVTVGESKTCKVVKDEIAEHVALIATSSNVQPAPAPAPAPAATPAATPATPTGSITNSINVKTGDDMNVYPALIAMALSLITGVSVVAFRRKRETK